MPRYAKKQRTYRRSLSRRSKIAGAVRKYGYRKRYSKARTFRSPWKSPVPRVCHLKMRYADSGFTFTTATPYWIASRVFRGNSVYDPDYTGTGVQPYGYDNYFGLNAPFGQYTVVGSKIRISPHPTSTGATLKALRLIVLPVRQVSPTYTSFNDLAQVPGARMQVINDGNDHIRDLSAYCSTKKMYPASSKYDSDFQALYSSNPQNQWFWYVAVDSLDTALAATVVCDVRITYYVIGSKTDTVNYS